MFGDDYPTEDGTCVRDYIHVADLADAHIRALHWLDGHEGFQAFNLGNGKGYSVRQVIDTVEKVSGIKVPMTISARRAGDPAVLVADARKAKEVLVWEPRMPTLNDIVGTAWNWHRSIVSEKK